MSDLYIGLLSGTSVDAIDAILVEFPTPDSVHVLATHAGEYDAGLKKRLVALGTDQTGVSLRELGELNAAVGLSFATAANQLLDAAGVTADKVRAIGSHGQTVYHAPDASPGFSIQIGDPALIADRTKILTVADFRSGDMAAGGQGAPLVPAFHAAVFGRDEPVCVVNIGGISNITVINSRDPADISGFDTGPGNALMDQWIEKHLGEPYDANGEWASSAPVHGELLQALLTDPYLERLPPKSTGRDYYNLGWLEARIDQLPNRPTPAEVQSTLAEFTCRSLASAIQAHAANSQHIYICGGGAHNPLLMDSLSTLLSPCPVATTDTAGLSADWVEASAFAWLAMRRLARLSGNLPSVTGASRSVVLGAVYEAREPASG